MSSHSARHFPNSSANSGRLRHACIDGMSRQVPNERNCRGFSVDWISTNESAPSAFSADHLVKASHCFTNSASLPAFTVQLPALYGWSVFGIQSSSSALPDLWQSHRGCVARIGGVPPASHRGIPPYLPLHVGGLINRAQLQPNTYNRALTDAR